MITEHGEICTRALVEFSLEWFRQSGNDTPYISRQYGLKSMFSSLQRFSVLMVWSFSLSAHWWYDTREDREIWQSAQVSSLLQEQKTF